MAGPRPRDRELAAETNGGLGNTLGRLCAELCGAARRPFAASTWSRNRAGTAPGAPSLRSCWGRLRRAVSAGWPGEVSRMPGQMPEYARSRMSRAPKSGLPGAESAPEGCLIQGRQHSRIRPKSGREPARPGRRMEGALVDSKPAAGGSAQFCTAWLSSGAGPATPRPKRERSAGPAGARHLRGPAGATEARIEARSVVSAYTAPAAHDE